MYSRVSFQLETLFSPIEILMLLPKAAQWLAKGGRKPNTR
uniref:Uncharacterized protein n=1 Tax=Rhizophora mucronata TaxID=61149 RepID=A0A2P2QTR5_RHIMU